MLLWGQVVFTGIVNHFTGCCCTFQPWPLWLMSWCHSPQTALSCVLSDSLPATSLHRSCSTQLPLLFHHNKPIEIHKTPGSPETWRIQFMSGHFPHLIFLTRNAPTPGPSRIVVVSCTFLVNGLGPPRLYFRPHGTHRLWQEVLYLSYRFVSKATQTIKTSWGGMPY